MSVCQPCLRVCNVPLCVAEVILGTISSISTDVNILIENKSTGAKKIVATQSDNTGKVTLVTSGLSLMADQSYELSVLLKTATTLCDREILTIGSSTASCVTVTFENIKDSGGCQVSFESQTLTVIAEGTNPNIECCYLGILEGTYTEIVAALAGGIDTEKYSHVLITDFQTIYDQPDFDGAGAPKNPVVTKTSSITEPLLIGLLDATTLKAEAYSALYPKDKIRYDISFSQTEVMMAPAKGRITERIDHLNNRTDYDHRHILFKRYESAPASGIFNQYKDNGGASQEFTTFQFAQEIIDNPIANAGGFSHNNFIGDYALFFISYGNPFILCNNVFGKNAESNDLPQFTRNSTFGVGMSDNTINGTCDSVICGDGFRSNHFRSLSASIFGNTCSFNAFYGAVGIVTTGDGFTRNEGGEMQNCIFVNGCTNNHMGAVVGNIDFSLATHVYASYNCDIFYNTAAVARLSYFDAADVLTVVNANA